FGIPFDPKRYYKDGDCARKLRRPRTSLRRKEIDNIGGESTIGNFEVLES
ncbi:hypothetical protein Tco_1241326, partial [Tanacetum coccineum]